jgi:large subunit ribosomal protein L17
MRHRKAGRRLSRTTEHRKATMKALTVSLFRHSGITTTDAKAKELRRFAEPLITMAKKDNLANRRRAFAALRDKDAVKRLFEEIAPTNADRPGGYTRVLKIGPRLGDNALLSRIELVGIGEFKEAEAD